MIWGLANTLKKNNFKQKIKKQSMRLVQFVLFLGLAVILFSSCQKGAVITGDFSDAGNGKAVLTRIGLDDSKVELGQAEMSGGKFKIPLGENFVPGLYSLGLGQQRIIFVMDGTEKKIEFSGSTANIQNGQYTVSGCPATAEVLETYKSLSQGQPGAQDLVNKVKNAKHPLAAGLMAAQFLGGRADFVDTHKEVLAKMKSDYPNSEFTKTYESFINQIEEMAAQQMASEKIKIGVMAPDISLPSPKGKTFRLSDLKGKVVLVDFWASWCAPCRRANPHVVEMYNKYNSKGFTVFSVSLDGVDSRMKNTITDPKQLDELTTRAKDAWLAAIAKDGLKWDTHVSDLKKWESGPAAEYGVHSIPKTFLLDKEGKVAALDPRDNLEEEIKKLL